MIRTIYRAVEYRKVQNPKYWTRLKPFLVIAGAFASLLIGIAVVVGKSPEALTLCHKLLLFTSLLVSAFLFLLFVEGRSRHITSELGRALGKEGVEDMNHLKHLLLLKYFPEYNGDLMRLARESMEFLESSGKYPTGFEENAFNAIKTHVFGNSEATMSRVTTLLTMMFAFFGLLMISASRPGDHGVVIANVFQILEKGPIVLFLIALAALEILIFTVFLLTFLKYKMNLLMGDGKSALRIVVADAIRVQDCHTPFSSPQETKGRTRIASWFQKIANNLVSH